MLLAVGHTESLEAQAAKTWSAEKELSLCNDWEELVNRIDEEAMALVPIYNSIYGHNLPQYRFLNNNDLKVVDTVSLRPKFVLASQSNQFEIVMAPKELLSLTNQHWRQHRSYMLKASQGMEDALQRAQMYGQYATLCTEAEAEAFELDHLQAVEHDQLKQVFAVVGRNLAKHQYLQTMLLVEIEMYEPRTLAMLMHPFKDEGVLVTDIFFIYDADDCKRLVITFADDYRRARVRKIINHIHDLKLGEVTVLGGKA